MTASPSSDPTGEVASLAVLDSVPIGKALARTELKERVGGYTLVDRDGLDQEMHWRPQVGTGF